MTIDVSMAINVMIDIMTYVVSSSLSLLPRLTLPVKSNQIKSNQIEQTSWTSSRQYALLGIRNDVGTRIKSLLDGNDGNYNVAKNSTTENKSNLYCEKKEE